MGRRKYYLGPNKNYRGWKWSEIYANKKPYGSPFKKGAYGKRKKRR